MNVEEEIKALQQKLKDHYGFKWNIEVSSTQGPKDWEYTSESFDKDGNKVSGFTNLLYSENENGKIKMKVFYASF